MMGDNRKWVTFEMLARIPSCVLTGLEAHMSTHVYMPDTAAHGKQTHQIPCYAACEHPAFTGQEN